MFVVMAPCLGSVPAYQYFLPFLPRQELRRAALWGILAPQIDQVTLVIFIVLMGSYSEMQRWSGHMWR